MPRTCTVCSHPDRRKVDRALVTGEPHRSIASRFLFSKDAVFRHQKHVAGQIARARLTEELASAKVLAAEVQSFRLGVARIIRKAEKNGDWRGAIAGFGELRRQVETRAKLGGDLKDPAGAGPTTNIYQIVFEGGVPRSHPVAIETTATTTTTTTTEDEP